MPADASVWDAVKAGGTLVLGGILTAFAKNFFTSDGKDAREFRQEYRDEIARLREEVRGMRHDHQIEIDDLRLQVEKLNRQSLFYLSGRSEARTLLNAHERTHGDPATTWPDDPH